MPAHQNYPQRRSHRLQGYDYSQAGLYFITICTHGRRWMFGQVVQDQMCLNTVGSIAQAIWNTLPERFAYVELDQFVVMPNHVHGIIAVLGPPSLS